MPGETHRLPHIISEKWASKEEEKTWGWEHRKGKRVSEISDSKIREKMEQRIEKRGTDRIKAGSCGIK